MDFNKMIDVDRVHEEEERDKKKLREIQIKILQLLQGEDLAMGKVCLEACLSHLIVAYIDTHTERMQAAEQSYRYVKAHIDLRKGTLWKLS